MTDIATSEPATITAAVLCPGPSLAAADIPDDYDHYIGVNRAVFKRRCDWWSFVDVLTFIEVIGEGLDLTPRIFTGRLSDSNLGHHTDDPQIHDSYFRSDRLHFEDE